MNRLETRLNDARRAASAKTREMRSLTTKALDPDLTASEKRALDREIAALNPELNRLEAERDRHEALAEAREKIPPSADDVRGYRGDGMPWSATARASLNSEGTYRPDDSEPSVFRDLVGASHSPS